ncbi:hypothetical protein CDAR_111051 [Caerostris darwini]|uniref:Uncharacterized protein n=1 Tax=Caerostris darwini TaxID=1538125 RepID=A0AAV4SYB8_9ARAC|nr:hypothetical protein CDAR_111051 [Caerostris darwini]
MEQLNIPPPETNLRETRTFLAQKPTCVRLKHSSPETNLRETRTFLPQKPTCVTRTFLPQKPTCVRLEHSSTPPLRLDSHRFAHSCC